MKNVKSIKFLAAALPALLLAAATVSTIGSLTVGSGAAIAEASPIRGTRMTSENTPQGARGTVVTWTIRAVANGHPVANMPVAVTWNSRIRGATVLPPVQTDARGYARISFRIPTNVNDDNINLTAISGGGPFTAVVSQRVAIGR